MVRSSDVFRRRKRPQRVVGDRVVVASFRDGAPLVLSPSAAVVWTLLADWTTEADLVRSMTGAYPAVNTKELHKAITGIVGELDGEGFLELG